MVIAGWVLLALGLVCYLWGFALGAGPRMGDTPLQATLLTGATVLMVLGLAFLVVI